MTREASLEFPDSAAANHGAARGPGHTETSLGFFENPAMMSLSSEGLLHMVCRTVLGLLMVTLVLTGCGRRTLTERDHALCVRVADFAKCGWNLEDYQVTEQYGFRYDGRGSWMVNCKGEGFDSRGRHAFTVEFTVTCGPLVAIAGWDSAQGQMEGHPEWMPAGNMITHTPTALAYQHLKGIETNATMACWMESGKMFRLGTSGLPIRSAEEFSRLIQDKTNDWSRWDPGEDR
jgi:hypothetical protein